MKLHQMIGNLVDWPASPATSFRGGCGRWLVWIVFMGLAACGGAGDAFRPGEVWLDTAGKPIQAHSAGILRVGNTWYWYGEDKTLGDFNKTGVSCYSSTDLYHWKHEGVVLPKQAMPPSFRDTCI